MAWCCGFETIDINCVTTPAPTPSSESSESFIPTYGMKLNKYLSDEQRRQLLKPNRTGFPCMNILHVCRPKYGTICSSMLKLCANTPNWAYFALSRSVYVRILNSLSVVIQCSVVTQVLVSLNISICFATHCTGHDCWAAVFCIFPVHVLSRKFAVASDQ